MSSEIKSIILAGGYGTRLKEHGINKPKGLIEFQDKTLIDDILEKILACGISDIALVTNAKYVEHYQRWAQSLSTEIRIINDGTLTPETRLGALGDLLLAIEQLQWHNEQLLVAPSDTYFDFSLQDFVTLMQNFPHSFTTILRQISKDVIRGRLGCAVISETNQITHFLEKPQDPPSDLAAIPFYGYNSKVLALLPRYQVEGNSMDAPGNIIPWLLKRHFPVQAYVVQEQTLDVGTPEDIATLGTLTMT